MGDSSLVNNNVVFRMQRNKLCAAFFAWAGRAKDANHHRAVLKRVRQRVCAKAFDQDKLSKLDINMNEDHLMKELEVLKNRFPKLEENYILNILKEKKGHAGKATQAIFEAGGDGVKEAEEEFYKRFPGTFQDRLLRPEMRDMFYLWNINYDGSFVRDRPSKIFKDKDGKEIKLFQLDSFMHEIGDPRYKNHKYFDSLAHKGDNVYEDGEWGTDPFETYDENHILNEKGVIMTIYELEVIIHIWKIPLLGIHPYTNEEGIRCNYIGKEVRNRIKKKLPEGWARSASKDYNGLWSYLNKEKNIVQWDHPLE